MSALSGLGNKGDKNQAKFKSLDINNLYKGTSNTPQKSAPASSRQHGLQSLGKVAVRRMPPPANLPSLKSENGGLDPSINQVPPGAGPGWNEKSSPEAGVGPQRLLQPPLGVTQPLPEQVSAASQSKGGNVSHPSTMVAGGGSASGGGGGGGGAGIVSVGSSSVSWSSITSGRGKQGGGFLDQKSSFFQDEFPQLAVGAEEKTLMQKKEEESREVPYGPGPSLRPQNVANWRAGGGRGASQQPSSPPPLEQPSDLPPGGPPIQGHPGGPPGQHDPARMHPQPGGPPHPSMQMPMRPGMGGPMGPRGPMGPPHLMDPRFQQAMMMQAHQFAFRGGFPPYPQNFMFGGPGMPRPPFMNPEFRFRGMMPTGVRQARDAGSSDDAKPVPQRPSIIKDRDLQEFDKLEISDGGGWARAVADVDYNQRLFFDDDLDGAVAECKKGERNSDRQASTGSGVGGEGRGGGERRTGTAPPERRSSERERPGSAVVQRQMSGKDRVADTDVEQDTSREKQRSGAMGGPPMMLTKEAWMSQQQQQGPFMRPPQGPMDPCHWTPHPIPFDRHGAPMPFAGQRAPFIPQQQQQPAQFGGGPPGMGGGVRGPASGGGGAVDVDEDDMWRQRRKQQSEEMSTAIERARQRREEEERRMNEEQKAAAAEKLRQLEQKFGRKDSKAHKDSTGSDVSESGNQRRFSESDDKNQATISTLATTSKSSGSVTGGQPPALTSLRVQRSTSQTLSDGRQSSPDTPTSSDLVVSPHPSMQRGSPQSSVPGLHPHFESPGPHPRPLRPQQQHPYWQQQMWATAGMYNMMDPRMMGHRMPLDPSTGFPMCPIRPPADDGPANKKPMSQQALDYMNSRRAWADQHRFMGHAAGYGEASMMSGEHPGYYGGASYMGYDPRGETDHPRELNRHVSYESASDYNDPTNEGPGVNDRYPATHPRDYAHNNRAEFGARSRRYSDNEGGRGVGPEGEDGRTRRESDRSSKDSDREAPPAVKVLQRDPREREALSGVAELSETERRTEDGGAVGGAQGKKVSTDREKESNNSARRETDRPVVRDNRDSKDSARPMRRDDRDFKDSGRAVIREDRDYKDSGRPIRREERRDEGRKREAHDGETLAVAEEDDHVEESQGHDGARPQDNIKGGDKRKSWQPADRRSACPPPISAEQSRQNVPSASSYTSLKRTHSNISNRVGGGGASGGGGGGGGVNEQSVGSMEASKGGKNQGGESNKNKAPQKSLSRESLKSTHSIDKDVPSIPQGNGSTGPFNAGSGVNSARKGEASIDKITTGVANLSTTGPGAIAKPAGTEPKPVGKQEATVSSSRQNQQTVEKPTRGELDGSNPDLSASGGDRPPVKRAKSYQIRQDDYETDTLPHAGVAREFVRGGRGRPVLLSHDRISEEHGGGGRAGGGAGKQRDGYRRRNQYGRGGSGGFIETSGGGGGRQWDDRSEHSERGEYYGGGSSVNAGGPPKHQDEQSLQSRDTRKQHSDDSASVSSKHQDSRDDSSTVSRGQDTRVQQQRGGGGGGGNSRSTDGGYSDDVRYDAGGNRQKPSKPADDGFRSGDRNGGGGGRGGGGRGGGGGGGAGRDGGSGGGRQGGKEKYDSRASDVKEKTESKSGVESKISDQVDTKLEQQQQRGSDRSSVSKEGGRDGGSKEGGRDGGGKEGGRDGGGKEGGRDGGSKEGGRDGGGKEGVRDGGGKEGGRDGGGKEGGRDGGGKEGGWEGGGRSGGSQRNRGRNDENRDRKDGSRSEENRNFNNRNDGNRNEGSKNESSRNEGNKNDSSTNTSEGNRNDRNRNDASQGRADFNKARNEGGVRDRTNGGNRDKNDGPRDRPREGNNGNRSGQNRGERNDGNYGGERNRGGTGGGGRDNKDRPVANENKPKPTITPLMAIPPPSHVITTGKDQPALAVTVDNTSTSGAAGNTQMTSTSSTGSSKQDNSTSHNSTVGSRSSESIGGRSGGGSRSEGGSSRGNRSGNRRGGYNEHMDSQEQRPKRGQEDGKFDRNGPSQRSSSGRGGDRMDGGGLSGGQDGGGRGGGGRGGQRRQEQSSRGQQQPSIHEQAENYETASEGSDHGDQQTAGPKREQERDAKQQSQVDRPPNEPKKSFSSQRPNVQTRRSGGGGGGGGSGGRYGGEHTSYDDRAGSRKTGFTSNQQGRQETPPLSVQGQTSERLSVDVGGVQQQQQNAGPSVAGTASTERKTGGEKADGSNGDIVHHVYRLDEVIFDDPAVIQAAIERHSLNWEQKYSRRRDANNNDGCDVSYDKSHMDDPFIFDSCDTRTSRRNSSRINRVDLFGCRTRHHTKKMVMDENGLYADRRRKNYLPPRFARLHASGKQTLFNSHIEELSNNGDCQVHSGAMSEHSLNTRGAPGRIGGNSGIISIFDLMNSCSSGERHDSGVDLSDPPYSTPMSSCRSSPCAGGRRSADEIPRKASDEDLIPDLDFTFDDDASDCYLSRASLSRNICSTPSYSLQQYLSEATDDLGLKITSVKNVWYRELETSSDNGCSAFDGDDCLSPGLQSKVVSHSDRWTCNSNKDTSVTPCCGFENELLSGSAVISDQQSEQPSTLAVSEKTESLTLSGATSKITDPLVSCGSVYPGYYDVPRTEASLHSWMSNSNAMLGDEKKRTGYMLPPQFGQLITVTVRGSSSTASGAPGDGLDAGDVVMSSDSTNGSGVIGQQRTCAAGSSQLLHLCNASASSPTMTEDSVNASTVGENVNVSEIETPNGSDATILSVADVVPNNNKDVD